MAMVAAWEPAHVRSSLLVALIVLVCASCLAGDGRLLYRYAPPPAPEPTHAPSFRKATPSAATPLPSPLSLTAADGTGLTLASLRVRGVVEGPLALTELHMDFVNGEDRTIEGRFEITLPPGAAISRFAMRVGDTWQEAEVVERQRARQVYEAILHQGLDPALLEQEAGNRFRARVFPIAAHETKELIVAYTQELSGGDDAYTIPLRGLPKLEHLEVEVLARGSQPSFRRIFEHHLAREDLVVPLTATTNVAFADQEFALARVVPVPADAPRPEPSHGQLEQLTILFDTSASRAVNFEPKLERLANFCAALREQTSGELPIALIAFDQTSETIYRGSLAGLGEQHFARLTERRALGATDLRGAIDGLREGAGKRLVLASDGVATAGEDGGPGALSEALARKGFVRVDVLVDGSLRDQDGLERLVREGLPFAGQVIELGKSSPAAAAARVRRPTLAPVSIEVEGASWVSPRELRGLQPGDEVLVFAQFEQPRRELRLALREQGHEALELRLKPASIHRALLERGIVQHRVRDLIAALEAGGERAPGETAVTERDIVELSTQHRVLTPYTAMLVLENQAAYDRFGLHRDALAPILGIGEDGVTLQNGRDEHLELDRVAELEARIGDSLVQVESKFEPDEPEPEFEARRGKSQVQLDTKFKAERDEPEPTHHYRSMEMLEAKAAQLMDQEKAQEQERIEYLRELERKALEARTQSEEIDVNLLKPEPEPEPEPDTPLAFQDADSVDGSVLPGESTDVIEPAPSPAQDGWGDDENPLEASPSADRAPARAEAPRRTPRRARHRPRHRTPHRTPRPAPPPKHSEVTVRRTQVMGSYDDSEAALERALERVDARVQRCYDGSLIRDGAWGGRLTLRVELDSKGRTRELWLEGGSGHAPFDQCLRTDVPGWSFPRTADGHTGSLQRRYALQAGVPRSRGPALTIAAEPQLDDEAPVEGRYADFLALLAEGRLVDALEFAEVWHDVFPGDPLALVCLGKALVAHGRVDEAARAYASLVDLHPSRADIRRFAGNLLESLPEPLPESALKLAIDSYGRAIEARPDQPSSYRMLAMAQARAGQLEAAFTTIEKALERNLPPARYAGVKQLLMQDLELLAGAWTAREPAARKHILRRVIAAGGSLDTEPSIRFVLSWETDASDVDLHVRDRDRNHAYYDSPWLRSGGALLADVTTGFGPEGLIIRSPDAFPYALSVVYYRRGVTGHGMGQVQILVHDGRGGLLIENRPFVVMGAGHELQLGAVGGPSPEM